MTASFERIIIFTRYPEPGETKTRLISALGPYGAADLQRQMTEHLLVKLKQLQQLRSVSLEVRYAGGDADLMRQWMGPNIPSVSQGGGDLGERMGRAFRDAFQVGLQRAIIVGTDCPRFTATLIELAFDVLKLSDVVIGPARDGGHYLIGLRLLIPQLFEGVLWGTEHVLEQTLQIAERLGLKSKLLDTLDDVDRPEDLRIWQQALEPSVLP